MSILIKGMEMPENCCQCIHTAWNGRDDVCRFSGISALNIGRQSDCPLIEVSEDVQPVKWISVYDQLPDYNMVVLVTDGEDVGTGYRYALGETGFMGWAIPFADIEEDDISHWMPLPEPPKEKANGQ